MTSDETRTGGCLCGQLRYTVPATPTSVVVCHCRDCQRQAGSAYSIIAVFPRDAVRIEGKLAEFESTADSGNRISRHFCASCGSPIYSDNEVMRKGDILAVKAGTLDDVSDLRPVVHYWVASRQPWQELPSDTPCLMKG